MPGIDVVATVIACEARILAVFNPRWGAFTLPMTKRRRWQEPELPSGYREEDWENAAARAAAEALGRTFLPEELPHLLTEVENYKQSDADGTWKTYHFRVFGLPVEPGTEVLPGLATEWLSPDRLRERRPLSRTAIDLVECLRERSLLPPW